MVPYVKIIVGILMIVTLIISGLFIKEAFFDSKTFLPKATEPTTIADTHPQEDFSRITRISIVDGSTGERRVSTNTRVIHF